MKIISLHVENIKKIKAVDITPVGNTVIISGKNGQGKSSVMDSIAMLLGGKKLIPEKPIRDGETTARIEADLGKYVVTRHWTSPETSYLKVSTPEGAKFPNPQNLLESLVGELSFDPLAFSTMEPSKRLATLRDLTKLDFTSLDEKFKRITEERRDVGRDGERLKARFESEFKDLPEELPPPSDIEEIKRARAAAHEKNLELKKMEDELSSNAASIRAIQNQITELTRDLRNLQSRNDVLESVTQNQAVADLSIFDSQLEAHYKEQSVRAKMAERTLVENQLKDARAAYARHTNELESIKVQKSDMIAKAQMPIGGLSFESGDVSYNGIPFAQLSQAEQIKVSMSIATAMNPKLRVVMIYHGSLLDDDAMNFVYEFAKEKDMQVWVERVADGPGALSIYIEDGEVVE